MEEFPRAAKSSERHGSKAIGAESPVELNKQGTPRFLSGLFRKTAAKENREPPVLAQANSSKILTLYILAVVILAVVLTSLIGG